MHDAPYWIRKLRLREHPEGGYYRETYRAGGRAAIRLPGRKLPVRRSYSTAIYFLLRSGQASRLHRLRSDELWHFHAGSPLALHFISPAGGHSRIILGPDPDAGQVFQAVVPAGWWFGAAVERSRSFSLAGCTVAPGFDFEDFELADRRQLLSRYPRLRSIILRLT